MWVAVLASVAILGAAAVYLAALHWIGRSDRASFEEEIRSVIDSNAHTSGDGEAPDDQGDQPPPESPKRDSEGGMTKGGALLSPKAKAALVAGAAFVIVLYAAVVWLAAKEQKKEDVSAMAERVAESDVMEFGWAQASRDASMSLDVAWGHPEPNRCLVVESVDQTSRFHVVDGDLTADVDTVLRGRFAPNDAERCSEGESPRLQIEIGVHEKEDDLSIRVTDGVSGAKLQHKGTEPGSWQVIEKDQEIDGPESVTIIEIAPDPQLLNDSGEFVIEVVHTIPGGFEKNALRRAYFAPCDFGEQTLQSLSVRLEWPMAFDTSEILYSRLMPLKSGNEDDPKTDPPVPQYAVRYMWREKMPSGMTVTLDQEAGVITLETNDNEPLSDIIALLYQMPNEVYARLKLAEAYGRAE